MTDLIDRQVAIDALEREKTYCIAFRDGYTPINVFEKYNAGLTDGIKALKNLPSAQPEIVRCKECIHSRCGSDGIECQMHYRPTKEQDFCSYGERREVTE